MSKGEPTYPRFRVMARIEHAILLVSFTVLAVTGLPQKYAATNTGEAFIAFMGGVETIRIIHRYAAFILTIGSIFHLMTIAYRLFVKREKMLIWFERKDLTDLVDTVKHNVGLQPHPPKMGKFNFGEKFEYWAVVWGTAVMAITGIMLWNPIAATSIFPGAIIPIAKAAHGGEALLAVLAIVIWHLYNVLIKQFNPSMFTGRLPRHQMEEEHALELERLEAGGAPWPIIETETLHRRRRIFIVACVIVGGILVGIVYWGATFEQTAITTIPRATQDIFVPLVTGTPIP